MEIKRNTVLKHNTKWVNLAANMLSKRSQVTEDYILYDSIYMKRPDKANSQRQRVDQWLPGELGGNGEWQLNGDEVPFGGWWKCSKIVVMVV